MFSDVEYMRLKGIKNQSLEEKTCEGKETPSLDLEANRFKRVALLQGAEECVEGEEQDTGDQADQGRHLGRPAWDLFESHIQDKHSQ